MMLYITDVTLGGGTYFSSEKYEDVIFPERGSALLWFNLKSSGLEDFHQDINISLTATQCVITKEEQSL